MFDVLASVGQWVLIAGVVGVVLAFRYFAVRGERIRAEDIARRAAARGWTYTREKPELVEHFEGRQPFDRGSQRSARNVVVGTDDGRRFVTFDLTYLVSSSGSVTKREREWVVVTALALPTRLPRVEVVPESLLSRVFTGAGVLQDVNVESDDFNQRFRVVAQSPKLALDLLHPRQIEALLAGPDRPWRVEGAEILCWRSGPMEPSQIDLDLALLTGIVDRVPRFVWLDRGYDPDNAASDDDRSSP